MRAALVAALVSGLVAGLSLAACGGGSEADRLGIGAQCAANVDCDEAIGLYCLPQFKGGYCGLSGCALDVDCPDDSACIQHTDGIHYCFRLCVDKVDCNANRDVDNEANCSSNVTFAEGANGRKACVPPSGA